MIRSKPKETIPSFLTRYERTPEGTIAIDIAVDQVEALYDDYDKDAPYIRRDLQKELVDYLIECAKELAPDDFVIRFTFDVSADHEKESRVRHSINTYFIYLGQLGRQEVVQMFRRSAILFAVGISILSLSVTLNLEFKESSSVVANVFTEGLTVAAWVSLWESLAIFLIEWSPHRRKNRIFQRLSKAEIIFRSKGQK